MTSGLKTRLVSTLMLVLGSGLVGCSMFEEQLRPELAASVVPADGVVQPQAEEKYTVEMHSEKGKVSVVEKPLGDQLHVQDALEQTGGHKKYKRFFLELFRPMPNGGWHNMTLAFDSGSKRVDPEFDYAVLPGDRIVVTEDPSTMFDDLMRPVLKPLGMSAPDDRRARVAAKYQIGG